MNDRELMQQALEALEADEHDMVPDQEGHMVFRKEAAITALRERLAQPEQDVPVGWLESPDGAFRANPLYKIKFPSKLLSWQVPLYMALAQPDQEPVALAWDEGYRQGVQDERTSEANIGIAGFGAKVQPARQNPYGTTPTQRTWVDLTPKEIEACRQQGYANGGLNAAFDFDKAAGELLAKAKEKNT